MENRESRGIVPSSPVGIFEGMFGSEESPGEWWSLVRNKEGCPRSAGPFFVLPDQGALGNPEAWACSLSGQAGGEREERQANVKGGPDPKALLIPIVLWRPC